MSDTLSAKLDENDGAIFHNTPRTLLELASMKLALNIWLEKFSEVDPEKRNSYIELSKLQFEAETLTEVPIIIRKMVESRFQPIAAELDCWFRGAKHILRHLSCAHIYNRFNLVVFGGNGTVHFKDTISNFLEDDSLDNLTKFEMACVYCIEEKIDVFWPLVYDTFYIDDMHFDFDFMMYYWICRKRGELNRIPLEDFNSIESIMIHKCSWHPVWLALEYFLNLLQPDDRLDEINRLFESYAHYACAKYLLPYFETSVQRHVLNLNGTRIVTVFVLHRELFDYAIQSWLYIKEFISNEKFYREIVQHFIQERNRNYDVYSNVCKYEYVEMVLAEIWFNSPHHLKEFVLNFHFLDLSLVMSTFRGDLLKNSSRNISFLLAMLSDADIDLRKKFWEENWSKWIIGVSSAHLSRLMALCLGNTEAIDDFKRTLKKSDLYSKYCDTLVTRRYANELDEFLTWICSNQQEVLDAKIKLITINDDFKRCIYKSLNVDEIRKSAEFVEKLLSNDSLVKDFKNQFILADANLKMLYDHVERNSLIEIESIVDNFVSAEKRSKLKETLLDKFRSRIIKGALHGRFDESDCGNFIMRGIGKRELIGFDESDCENFLMWCVENDQQRIRHFKESLPILEIFVNVFSQDLADELNVMWRVSRFQKNGAFENLNRFLKWYFQSTSLCKHFINERVECYQGMLEAEVERIFGVDKESVIEKMSELLSSDFEESS